MGRSLLLGVVLCSALGTRASATFLLIDPTFGSTEDTGATARLDLSFSELGPEDLLHVSIENTTPDWLGSSLTAVGFEIPDGLPASISLVEPSAYFDELDFDVSIPPGWLDASGGYDLMLTSDGRFPGGNPHGAPEAGESQSVVLSLGDTGFSPVELEILFTEFYVDLESYAAIGRFQSVGPHGELSDKVAGAIPEPGTLALLAAGGLTFFFRGRSRLPK